MTIKYLPIYRAKRGEFEAVAKAKKIHARRMLPLFEIPKITDKVLGTVKLKDHATPTCAYLEDIARQIANATQGRIKDVMVDISQWNPDSLAETGEHVLPYLYSTLKSQDIGVIPVVDFDSWGSPIYRMAMQDLELPGNGHCCLRLDSHAIEDAEDPMFLEQGVLDIFDGLSTEPDRCSMILDFGEVTALPLAELIGRAERVMQVLAPMGFKFFATAGCSLPPSIDGAVKKRDSTGKVLRKEMLLWQALKVEYPHLTWVFGDYGVRGPNSADVIAPDANGKIRYTIDRSYYVVRGHSMRQGDKGAQTYKLAEIVVNSPYYMGKDFSWGDEQILLRSQKQVCPENKIGPGNHTTWIAIDTSHHLAWIMAEVEEFELRIANSRVAV